MTLFFNFFFLAAFAEATLPSLGTKGSEKHIDIDLNKGELNIHRQLKGCDFECPAHSERKPGKSCYKDIGDCECNLGYTLNKSQGMCQAPQGLCSEEYADSVTAMVDEVNFYVDQTYRATNPEERYGYYEHMEVLLSDAWDAYNRGKASCEVELGDNFMDDDFDGRALLRDRKLFFKKVRRAFQKATSVIKTAVKAVARVVVATVETVVNVVVELVECGVGIATDGLKCGLIGCAFGLIGVALDIAFTLATGGLSKASTAACSLVDIVTGNDDDKNDAKKEKASVLAPLLEGIGGAVCTINDKLDSPVLKTVCDLKEEAESIDSGLAVAELIVSDPISFRFLETFRNAMCGNPGSAVFDLLEEVVSCSIGCAKEDNAFCPADEEEEKPVQPKPTQRPPANNTPPPPPANDNNDPVPDDNKGGNPPAEADGVEYEQFKGQACRDDKGKKGKEGKDFDLADDISSEQDCQEACSESEDCKGFEYNQKAERCELWTTRPTRFEDNDEFDCFVKED